MGREDLPLLHNLTTTGADIIARVARFGAGRFLGVAQFDFVAQGGDHLSLCNELATVRTVDVAGIAFFGAGGFLPVANFGVSVFVGDFQCLAVSWGQSVDLLCQDRDPGLSPRPDLENQSRHRGPGGNLPGVRIGKFHRAIALCNGLVVCMDHNGLESQMGHIITGCDEAVGGCNVLARCILGGDFHGDSLLVLSSLANGIRLDRASGVYRTARYVGSFWRCIRPLSGKMGGSERNQAGRNRTGPHAELRHFPVCIDCGQPPDCDVTGCRCGHAGGILIHRGCGNNGIPLGHSRHHAVFIHSGHTGVAGRPCDPLLICCRYHLRRQIQRIVPIHIRSRHVELDS